VAKDHSGFKVSDFFTRDDWQTNGSVEEIEQRKIILVSVFELALCNLWRANGIEPEAVAGVCSGEIAAAYTTGALSLEVIWGFSIWTDDQWVCVTGDYDMRPRKLSPGSGELRCLIPRNPLVAGSYWLKASIIDPASRRPLAMLGEQNPPQAFFVRSHPTELNNAFTAMNQLVTLDVKWQ
jgi:hypothetical protein